MDGTIVDSEPLHFEAFKESFKQFGINLTMDDYMDFGVAKGDRELVEKLSEKYQIRIGMEKALKAKEKTYRIIFEKKTIPMKGALELIENLSQKYILAIASSGAGKNVYFVLKKLGILKYFHQVITADNVERLKPFPDIYEKSYKMLGLKKEECIAIEDSETGLASAKSAGLKCVAIPCKFTKNQNFSQADLILEDLSKITEEKIEALGR